MKPVNANLRKFKIDKHHLKIKKLRKDHLRTNKEKKIY